MAELSYGDTISEEKKFVDSPNPNQDKPSPRSSADNLQPLSHNIHHHRRTLRAWIIFSASFLCLSPLVSVMLGLHLRDRDFSYKPDRANLAFTGRSLLLEAVLVDADPIASTMVFDWTILNESANSPCTNATLDKCTDINIFFDNNLLSGSDPSAMRTSDPPTIPLFRHNATGAILQDITANTPTFRTELQLFSPGNHESSLIYYPFDIYTAEIFAFALDAKTNQTVGLILASTRGIAVGFKTDAVDYPGVPIPAGMMDIFVTLQRGNLIRAFCIIATIAIWLITLILLLVMFTCVFFGFRQRSEVLIIPVATVFAFTQLRGSMPGAPSGFGDVLDFVGLLPCLALLSVSAAFTLGAFIFTDPTDKPHALNWDLLYEAFPMFAPRAYRQVRVERNA